MDAFLLGIDAGGSKTVALLADASGAVLGRGVAGAGNLRAVGEEAAAAALAAAVEGAFGCAGLPVQPVAAACLGAAGAGRPAERAVLERWAAARPLAAHTLVCDDARLVLAAGGPDGWGVALIGGAGSIAVGYAPDGRTAHAGGWGYLLGDEGSGRDIALAGLRAACRAADGRGPSTALLPALLGRWALTQPEALIARVYEAPAERALLAEVPPVVAAAAEAGDEVARAILERAGEELALAAAAVITALALTPPIPLALAGGALVNMPLLRAALLGALARRGMVVLPALVHEPALGALRLAARLAHQPPAIRRS
jgi:N-acetylglucosamine kinase-like BadF-type ATPase